MKEGLDRVVSLPTGTGAPAEQMLGADLVQEMVARKERGESASVPFSRDDIPHPRVQPRERAALLAQVIVSGVNCAVARAV